MVFGVFLQNCKITLLKFCTVFKGQNSPHIGTLYKLHFAVMPAKHFCRCFAVITLSVCLYSKVIELFLCKAAKMSGTNWGTDLGQLPIWMLWPHVRVYGQDWWLHGPSDVPTQPMGCSTKIPRLARCLWGEMQKARMQVGLPEEMQKYLGTVSLFSRWLVWKLAYTFFFFFWLPRTCENKDKWKLKKKKDTGYLDTMSKMQDNLN